MCSNSIHQSRRKVPIRRVKKGQTGVSADHESWRHVEADLSHLAETSTLAPQELLVFSIPVLKRKYILVAHSALRGKFDWLGDLALQIGPNSRADNGMRRRFSSS